MFTFKNVQAPCTGTGCAGGRVWRAGVCVWDECKIDFRAVEKRVSEMKTGFRQMVNPLLYVCPERNEEGYMTTHLVAVFAVRLQLHCHMTTHLVLTRRTARYS